MNQHLVPKTGRCILIQFKVQFVFTIAKRFLPEWVGRKQPIPTGMPVSRVSWISGMVKDNERYILTLNDAIQCYPFRTGSPHIVAFDAFAAYIMPCDAIVVGLSHFGDNAICVSKLARLIRGVLKATCQADTQYPLLIIR